MRNPDYSRFRKECTRIALALLCMLAGWLPIYAAPQSEQVVPVRDVSSLTSIGAVAGAHSAKAAGQVTVRGTVTYVGRFITLQDQTGAINVIPIRSSVLLLGDEAEAIGTDRFEDQSHTIVNAGITSLWRSSPPPPLALTPDDAANGEHNWNLVQVHGKVLRVDQERDTTRLQMEGDHQFFSVQFNNSSYIPEPHLISLKPNSILRLTGVLSVSHEQYNTAEGSFRIYLRSLDDVLLVAGPPWGTKDHIVELVIGLVLCGVLIQMLHVRNVERQFAAILQERARIARDIHDTLAQGFAGLALQLEVVKSSLTRDKTLADVHLLTALGMVRHSRAEAHRSIATLRAFSSVMPLDKMLCEMLTTLSATAPITFHLEVAPLRHEVPQDTAEQLFRICQEAVANCLQHARATHTWVRLSESASSVELTVRDDGTGFDPGQIAHLPMIHFGLTGMRERVSRVKGSLSIDSGPHGTTVQVSVPFAPSKPGFLGPVLRLSRRVSALYSKKQGTAT